MASTGDNVIVFPRMIRVEKYVESAPEIAAAIAHDGAAYPADAVFRHVARPVLLEVMALAPRSAQEAWDMLVRRFPRDAAQAVARIAPGSALR